MANRHQSRVCVIQSLYEIDLRPKADILEIIKRNLEEKSNLDKKYIKETTQGVLKNLKKIDKLIKKSAPEWPLEQIARVDKNILRAAIYELLFFNKKTQVPPKVAIDEAVEIAKTFGGENSSKFVNGVLGTIYRKSGKEAKDTKGTKDTEEAKDTKDTKDAKDTKDTEEAKDTKEGNN